MTGLVVVAFTRKNIVEESNIFDSQIQAVVEAFISEIERTGVAAGKSIGYSISLDTEVSSDIESSVFTPEETYSIAPNPDPCGDCKPPQVCNKYTVWKNDTESTTVYKCEDPKP